MKSLWARFEHVFRLLCLIGLFMAGAVYARLTSVGGSHFDIHLLGLALIAIPALLYQSLFTFHLQHKLSTVPTTTIKAIAVGSVISFISGLTLLNVPYLWEFGSLAYCKTYELCGQYSNSILTIMVVIIAYALYWEKKTNPQVHGVIELLAGGLTCYSAISLSKGTLKFDSAAAIAGGAYLLVEGFQIVRESWGVIGQPLPRQ